MKVSIDKSDLMKRKPFLVIYGDLRTGKSTDVARAFPDYLYMLTSAEALRPVESLRMKMLAEGADPATIPVVPTKRVLVPFTNDISNPDQNFPVAEWFRDRMREFCAEALAGKMSAGGIVIDEFSTLLDWIWADLRTRNGKSFATNDKLLDLVRWLSKIPGATGKALICVSHPSLPTYFEEGANAGQLKYPGGPKMPMGSMIRSFCQETSGVLHLVVEPSDALDPLSAPRRYYATAAHPLWVRGMRDARVEPTENLGLRELILRCGYDV